MNKVSIVCDGMEYSGWSDLEITRSIDSLCGSFAFAMRDTPANGVLGPGLPIQIFVDGVLIMTGFIEYRSRKLSSNQYSIAIGGREKTGDLVDCTAEYKSGRWLKATSIVTIANNLTGPYGIKCKSDTATSLSVFSLNDGETVFQALDRICRMKKLLQMTTPEGDILFTTTGKTTAFDQLYITSNGSNVMSHEDHVDYTDRFSSYTVKCQAEDQSETAWFSNEQAKGKWATSISGTAIDEWLSVFFGRYRRLVLHPEYMASNKIAKDTAEWEAKVRAARSETIELTVHGWEQGTSGVLWEPNTLVHYKNEFFDIDDLYIISSVVFVISAQDGVITKLSLRNKDAYKPEPLRPSKPRKKSSSITSRNWFSNDQVEKTTTTTTIDYENGGAQ